MLSGMTTCHFDAQKSDPVCQVSSIAAQDGSIYCGCGKWVADNPSLPTAGTVFKLVCRSQRNSFFCSGLRSVREYELTFHLVFRTMATLSRLPFAIVKALVLQQR